MHFQERERQGELGATLGDMEVTGVKQHELVDWYFANQAERCGSLPAASKLLLHLLQQQCSARLGP